MATQSYNEKATTTDGALLPNPVSNQPTASVPFVSSSSAQNKLTSQIIPTVQEATTNRQIANQNAKTMSSQTGVMGVLTPEQQTQYFSTQGQSATPMSPTQWLATQNKPAQQSAQQGTQGTETPPKTVEDKILDTPDTGYKFAYQKDGTRVEIPFDQSATSYGLADQDPTKIASAAEQAVLDQSNKDFTQAETNRQNIETQLSQIENGTYTLSPDEQAMVNNVRTQYQNLINEQIKANQNLTGGMTTFQNLLGTGQYSPAVALGAITQTITDGNQKVADLNNKMNDTISTMTYAFKTNKLSVLNAAYKRYNDIITEKTAAIKEINDRVMEQTQQERERMVTVNRDIAIGNLLGQNITDPMGIMKTLNRSGFKVTSKDVADSIKNFVGDKVDPLESLSVDLRDFEYLNTQPNRGGLPSYVTNPVEYLAYKKQLEKGVSTIASSMATDSRGTPGDVQLTMEDIRGLPVSDITKAVMSGYAGLKELTPTDKSKVVSEMYAVGFNPKTYIMNKLNGLIALYAQVPENNKGLIEGLVKTPFTSHSDPKVAQFVSAQEVLTREIARLNDVGMLSDQDVASYKRAMPSLMDNGLPTVMAKVSGLSQTIAGQKASSEVGKVIQLNDGRQAVVGYDGETLFDPKTGLPLEDKTQENETIGSES